MIASFWNELFDLADEIKAKKGSDSPEYKTIQKVEDVLQKAYDYNTRISEEIIDYKPKRKSECLAFKCGHVQVFKDRDGYYYEMDGRHFDTPTELIETLLEDREHKYKYIKKNLTQRFALAMKKTMYEEAEQRYLRMAEKLKIKTQYE